MTRLRPEPGSANFGRPGPTGPQLGSPSSDEPGIPDGEVTFAVRVIPRARKTTCSGFRDQAIVVRVAAPPVEGAANEALIAFFSDALHLPRRAIRIVSGERGRQKRIAIAGVTTEQIRALVP